MLWPEVLEDLQSINSTEIMVEDQTTQFTNKWIPINLKYMDACFFTS